MSEDPHARRLIILASLWYVLGAWQPLAAVVAPTEPVDMISWELQRGGINRLTIWADGRSEVVLLRWGEPRKTKPGWTASFSKQLNARRYRKANPLSPDEAKQKFSEAIAAGIEDIRVFRNQDVEIADGASWQIAVRRNGQLKQVLLPEFAVRGAKDNKGSDNHRRFLEVEKILGTFDTNAFETPPARPATDNWPAAENPAQTEVLKSATH